MKLLEDNKIWLFAHSELHKIYGVSLEYIYKKRSESEKSNKASWKGVLINGELLIDYDSLPSSTKSKLPSREDILKQIEIDKTEAEIHQQSEITQLLPKHHSNYCRVTDYQFFLKKGCNQAKSEDLKQASGWLRLLNSYRTQTETKSIGFKTKAQLRQAVVKKLIDDKKESKGKTLYGFKVSSVRTLQEKELEWSNAYETALSDATAEGLSKIESEKRAEEAALSTLLHRNIGNNNRRILGSLNESECDRILSRSGKIDFSEWNAKTLCFLFMNPGKAAKYDFENIYRRYKEKCKEEQREPEVTLSGVKKFLSDKEVKLFTTRERHGWAEHDKMLPHVYGRKSKYSFSKGGYDGFQVDFESKFPLVGKDGKERPTRMMLTVVAVYDYMSGAITGYDIGLVEDGLMVRNMYRNHLNVCGGRSFVEIESDRFSGNLAESTKAIFTKTCNIITQPTPNDPEGKAPNPKGRYVERLIQELNRLAQNLPGWKGTNITSIDKNRKPNPDYRSENYVKGLAEGKQLIIELVNMYNHDLYEREKSRWQELEENINPEAPVITAENRALYLNDSRIETVTRGLISFRLGNRKYEYAFPEYDMHVHKMFKGFKVKVFFDETDMSSVDIFGVNDEYIGTLGKLHRIVKAKAEQTDEDRARFGRMQSNRKNTQERISRKALEVEASVYGLDISNMDLREATDFIRSARETFADEHHIDHRDLFAEALATPSAQQHQNYYRDRLITSQGETVPVILTKEERKTHEQMIREQAKKKFYNQTNTNHDNS